MATSALAKLKNRASAADSGDSREIQIPLDKIVFDPDQPRKQFTPDSLQEMAESLKEHGQIQAIVVQDNGDDTFTIVVGERRTRGAGILGLPTIRAKVRNDLTNLSRRLLFQLTENVQREDLTESELANSIVVLMRDIPGVQTPMSQRDIASSMGKSEGWVSRYVKFSDEGLQAKWVRTGILDTVEKVYRVTLLPDSVQAEILRRSSLPVGNDEKLETPLKRSVLEEFARDAKISKIAASVANSEQPSIGSQNTGSTEGHDDNQTQGATFGGLVKQAHEQTKSLQTKPIASASESFQAAPGATLSGTGTYQLPSLARDKIVSSEPVIKAKPLTSMNSAVALPVQCKVDAASVVALLGLLEKSSKDIRSAAGSLQCTVVIPGDLAQVIANAMTKKKVAPGEAGAVVQRELAKLR